LQGDGTLLRLSNTLSDLATNTVLGPTGNAVKSLTDIGITVAQDGTLQLDSTVLSGLLAQNPTAVSNFFLDSTNGFAGRLNTLVKSFTDPLTGALTQTSNSLQNSVDSMEQRVQTLNTMMTTRQDRLMNNFIHLETVLSAMKSQQSALDAILSSATSVASNSSSSKSSSS
jgi:flagellar hook-associated protein 2